MDGHATVTTTQPIILPTLPDDIIQRIIVNSNTPTFGKGKEISIQFPVDWSWFQIISSSDGFICARFSYDLLSTHLIIWNPVTNTRKFIDNPATQNFPCNLYCPNLAWSEPLTVPSSLDILYIDPSGLLFGLHLHEIIISEDWGLEWATSRFCTFSYISQTPTIMVGDMVLGLIHSVTDLDISDPAFEGTLSEIQFTMIDVYTGQSFVAGTMRSNAILEVSHVYPFAPNLQKRFGCL
ncbi:hypothetical protein PIB30_030925 [Stylosanthes scabra]|uniref:F-box protein n=1 Tax=Stylosanthes scabra TaxID=79078 RepID=A0ABU6QBU9_9FABA|nr:hypothetical protein [Stylosanthes scabra]